MQGRVFAWPNVKKTFLLYGTPTWAAYYMFENFPKSSSMTVFSMSEILFQSPALA